MTALRSQRALSEWPVWAWWVLSSTIGGTAGAVVGLTAQALLSADARMVLDGVLVYGLLWAGMGVGQWLVLRRRIPAAGWWVAASALGGVLTGASAAVWSDPPRLVVAVAGMGLLLGVLQWLVLRRSVRRAGWWLLASPVACTVGFFAAQVLDRVWVRAGLPETAGLSILFGAMSGAAAVVTGAALVWLPLRAPPVTDSVGA